MSSEASAESTRYPDGIDERNVRPGGWRRHASPIGLLAFGAVAVLGLSGVLGHERDWVARDGGTRLEIHAPEVIRNGEFLEMRVRVSGDAAIAEPIIGVAWSLWEDMTVNTMIPAPADEESRNGEFRFTFAPVEAGDELLVKIDLQVNPDILGGNAGAVTVYDGESARVATEVEITVLP